MGNRRPLDPDTECWSGSGPLDPPNPFHLTDAPGPGPSTVDGRIKPPRARNRPVRVQHVTPVRMERIGRTPDPNPPRSLAVSAAEPRRPLDRWRHRRATGRPVRGRRRPLQRKRRAGPPDVGSGKAEAEKRRGGEVRRSVQGHLDPRRGHGLGGGGSEGEGVRHGEGRRADPSIWILHRSVWEEGFVDVRRHAVGRGHGLGMMWRI